MTALRFPSFEPPIRAVILGGGGIGAALLAALNASPDIAAALSLSRRDAADVPCDIGDEASIAAAAQAAKARLGEIDLVFVATGFLSAPGIAPEKSWRALDPTAMAELYRINAIGPALAAKHFLPLLPTGRKSVFAALSARVGSIGDNRLGGWHGYRASKAALNQIIKSLSIELARRNPAAIAVGLHPGTVATPLSAPFRGAAAKGVIAPERSAEALLTVIDGLTAAQSGEVFAWDGARIPE